MNLLEFTMTTREARTQAAGERGLGDAWSTSNSTRVELIVSLNTPLRPRLGAGA